MGASIRVRVETVDGPLGRVRNRAAELAETELLAFTDSDCVPTPGWLSAAVAPFADDPRLGIVQGPTLPEPGRPLERWVATQDIPEFSKRYECCNLVVRRSALLASPGFDEHGNFGEDTAGAYGILRGGWTATFAPDALVHHDVTYPGLRLVAAPRAPLRDARPDPSRVPGDPRRAALQARLPAPALAEVHRRTSRPGARPALARSGAARAAISARGHPAPPQRSRGAVDDRAIRAVRPGDARLQREGLPRAPQPPDLGGKSQAPANHWAVKHSGTAALTLSAEIRSGFDEFSRSQKDVGQYIVDHLDEASFHTAEELARRANTSSSTVVRFAQALGFEGFPELQAAARDEYRRAREGDDGAVDLQNPPLFPIDQTEFEAALAADHVNVEETARKLDRDEVEACDRADLARRAHRALRHRPDGLLRQLPAPPADAARPPLRGRGQPEPGGPRQARPHRREHRARRLLGRPAAPAGRARR